MSGHPPSSPARILVVDDEEGVRAGLCWSLRLSGYQVDEASSGPQALASLLQNTFDLILLDIRMPSMDGVELMARVRQQQPDLAIVVLTGHATVDSAVAAVKAGASDYLLKPVSIQDLQAAVSKALQARADLLRRQQVVDLVSRAASVLKPVEPPPAEASATVLEAGGITLDVARRLARVAGEAPRAVELTEAETAILQELMRYPDQVRTCRRLVYAAWGYDLSEAQAAGTVRTHIFRLRRKLEIDASSPQLIKTVRGGGYFLSRP
jgi:DNA-binding response OmpR family regulator